MLQRLIFEMGYCLLLTNYSLHLRFYSGSYFGTECCLLWSCLFVCLARANVEKSFLELQHLALVFFYSIRVFLLAKDLGNFRLDLWL